MRKLLGVFPLLVGLSASFASADDYFVKSFGEKLGDVDQQFSENHDKDAYSAGIFKVANEAATSPGLTSSEGFRILSELIGRNALDGRQLSQLQESIEKSKYPLKNDEKEIALEVIAFAKLDYSDKIATCMNTASPNEKGLTGFMKDMLSSNVNSYLKFVDQHGKAGKGTPLSNAVSGSWSSRFTGSNEFSANLSCKGVLARVYSGNKKSLGESFRSADSAIEGLSSSGSAAAQ